MALAVQAAPSAAASAPGTFRDPLDEPARLSPLAAHAPVFALARLDAERFVAVGPRGHVLRSDDRGDHWTQQRAPVSTDLVDVQFTSPTDGWAVGHDGVVLRTTDAGVTWHRVMDGRTVGAAMVKAYEERVAHDGSAEVAKALEEARRIAADGPAKPFLSVHFRSAREGWLVGQFNLILHTVDGGRTWEPWLERTENPQTYSLHAIRQVGAQVYIVGELGLILKLDDATGRFRQVKSPYAGSWFAVTGNARCVVALGLRGTAWRSCDGGAQWVKLETGTSAAVNAGLVTDDDRLVLVTQGGQVLVGALEAPAVKALPGTASNGSLHDVMDAGADVLLLAGERGLSRLRLPASSP